MCTQTSTPTMVRWFVDPNDLICPGCGEQVRCAPPAFRQVRDGLPVAQFSHPDRSVLCRTVAGRDRRAGRCPPVTAPAVEASSRAKDPELVHEIRLRTRIVALHPLQAPAVLVATESGLVRLDLQAPLIELAPAGSGS